MLNRDTSLLNKLYAKRKTPNNLHYRRFVLPEVNTPWYDVSISFNEATGKKGMRPQGVLWVACRYMLSYEQDCEYVAYELKTRGWTAFYTEFIDDIAHRSNFEAAKIKLVVNGEQLTNEQQIKRFHAEMQAKRKSMAHDIPDYFCGDGENICDLLLG